MSGGLVPRLAAGMGVLLVLGRLTFGTEPTPPPYHRFIVDGQVLRPSGGPRENFVVSLVGRFSFSQMDTVIEILEGFAAYADQGIRGVTDTSGMFTLDAKAPVRPDSIALKVSAPDQQSIVGGFFAVPESGIPIMGEERSSSSGCGGCNTVEPLPATTIGYRYQISHVTVTIPY